MSRREIKLESEISWCRIAGWPAVIITWHITDRSRNLSSLICLSLEIYTKHLKFHSFLNWYMNEKTAQKMPNCRLKEGRPEKSNVQGTNFPPPPPTWPRHVTTTRDQPTNGSTLSTENICPPLSALNMLALSCRGFFMYVGGFTSDGRFFFQIGCQGGELRE